MHYRVDQNIIEAIDLWISHGLEPGSCTTLLLKGEYDEAFLHAHPLIKPHWKDHITYVESLPDKYRGKNFESWKEFKQNLGEEMAFTLLKNPRIDDGSGDLEYTDPNMKCSCCEKPSSYLAKVRDYQICKTCCGDMAEAMSKAFLDDIPEKRPDQM